MVYVPTKPSILCSGCTSQEKNVPVMVARLGDSDVKSTEYASNGSKLDPLLTPATLPRSALHLRVLN